MEGGTADWRLAQWLSDSNADADSDCDFDCDFHLDFDLRLATWDCDCDWDFSKGQLPVLSAPLLLLPLIIAKFPLKLRCNFYLPFVYDMRVSSCSAQALCIVLAAVAAPSPFFSSSASSLPWNVRI